MWVTILVFLRPDWLQPTGEQRTSVVYFGYQSILPEACVNQTVKNGLFFVYISKVNKTEPAEKQNKQMQPFDVCERDRT